MKTNHSENGNTSTNSNTLRNGNTSNQRNTKSKKYEDFPLSLAFFDALPVIFFSAAMLIIAWNFHNTCFIIGAVLCALAGIGKVTWKIIIAGTKKDIVILNRQLRVLMPVGFLLIIVGLVTGLSGMHNIGAVLASILSFPAVFFFAVTVIGMIMMSVFACKLDGTKLRSNWIEQITNAIAQGCFLLGVLCVVL